MMSKERVNKVMDGCKPFFKMVTCGISHSYRDKNRGERVFLLKEISFESRHAIMANSYFGILLLILQDVRAHGTVMKICFKISLECKIEKTAELLILVKA